MKSFKTKLVNEGSSCLTIIKASGYFVCEVCKNSKNDIRMAVFFGGDLDDIRKHINNSNHKKAIKGKFN
uniref:DUF951 domain-containing protein n=1 Tax=Meloidogyne hapla TaxID=6305 RepID=A0A1I8B9P7_MELHA